VFADAGFDACTAIVDVSSRASVHALVETATARGEVTGVIHAAGVSPSEAPVERILAVDLYGTALVLEEFGDVVARGGAGVVISSQSGHRLPALTAEASGHPPTRSEPSPEQSPARRGTRSLVADTRPIRGRRPTLPMSASCVLAYIAGLHPNPTRRACEGAVWAQAG
jgi:NAD(P)-dependent dehydrogenase (short-subunit alcohol dehydrogenase family)